MFVGYTSSKGYGLIERELYMPEQWFSEDYAERRLKCQVPEDLVFKTKNQIGLELISKVLATGLFPAEWVGFDAGFGCDSEFRDAVDSMELKYLGDIKKNTLVWLNRPEVGIPPYSGKGRPAEKEQVLEDKPIHVSDIADDPELEWEITILAEGAQGPIIAQLCFMRVVECRDGLYP